MAMSPFFDFSNQTALIIGASRGLGKRAAQILSESGARVIIASRNIDELQSIADSLQNARAIKMDISDKISVRAAFDTLESDGEKINSMVCAAGIAGRTPIFNREQSENLFEKVIQTNLVGVWYVTECTANHMKKYHIAGSIIPIASISGTVRLRAGTAAYGVSKAGVIQLTRILTEELAKEGIRINCIVPGLFHTDMTDYKLNTPELKKAMAETIPLNFVSDPSDLDATILYLASNRASRYVTGSCLTIDGGESWVRYDKFKPKHPSDLPQDEK
jgi:NAD(P)-dependent dehydrogenase (short-subunit alcohol dehydrogenase family)